jgi:hypothetical protein
MNWRGVLLTAVRKTGMTHSRPSGLDGQERGAEPSTFRFKAGFARSRGNTTVRPGHAMNGRQ